MAVNLPGLAVAFVCRRSFGAGAAPHALFNPLMALVTKSGRGQQQQERRFRQLWALRFWHSARRLCFPLSALLIVIVILLPIELLSDGLAAVVCTCNLPQTATHTLPHTHLHRQQLQLQLLCEIYRFLQPTSLPSPLGRRIYAACTHCLRYILNIYTKYLPHHMQYIYCVYILWIWYSICEQLRIPFEMCNAGNILVPSVCLSVCPLLVLRNVCNAI